MLLNMLQTALVQYYQPQPYVLSTHPVTDFILLVISPHSPLIDNLTLILFPGPLVIVIESVRVHFILNKLFILTVLTEQSL